jgi:hypothetical protein
MGSHGVLFLAEVLSVLAAFCLPAFAAGDDGRTGILPAGLTDPDDPSFDAEARSDFSPAEPEDDEGAGEEEGDEEGEKEGDEDEPGDEAGEDEGGEESEEDEPEAKPKVSEEDLRTLALFSATKKTIKDGRITLTYEFERPEPSLLNDWEPSLSTFKDRLRWSKESDSTGGYRSSPRGEEGSSERRRKGLIAGDSGLLTHRASFSGDVLVTVALESVATYRKGAILAPVVYSPKEKIAIGANDGRQLVSLKGQKLNKPAHPEDFEPIEANRRHDVSCRFDGGALTGLYGKKSRVNSADAGGLVEGFKGPCQPGLAWSGSVRFFIYAVTITGKLDAGWLKGELAKGTKDIAKPGKKGAAVPPSVALEYVKTNLRDYLKPTSMDFSKDGQVRLSFDFLVKSEDHETIFTPTIKKGLQGEFRWSVPSEEDWISYTDGTKKMELAGLRIGNRGMALLNCWFKDEVSIEIEYQQMITQNVRQVMAVIFYGDKKDAVGSDFGAQCVSFKGGKKGEVKGSREAFLTLQKYKLKLDVGSGEYRASRNGKVKASSKYAPEAFASGRVGILWEGGLAGIITGMEVKGKVDAERMLEFLQKNARR